jgi:glucose-6-phosphate isomerase
MSIKFQYQTKADTNHNTFSAEFLLGMLGKFKATIDDEKYGFFHLTSDHAQIEKVRTVYDKFKDRDTFVQVGIGGSALGPQMLIDSLQKDFSKTFLFMDNVDSDYLFHQLQQIKDPTKALFYIVSKSGGTAETISTFAILRSWLVDHGIKEEDFKNYFVFCTDPIKGDLREMANEEGFTTLEVPGNVGGRFSVLTAVGLLPALFAGIDIGALYKGANELKVELLKEDIDHNPLLQTAAHLDYLNKEFGINQTIIMPYSSKLRTLAFWFVQLWAESLGKFKKDNSGESVGYTPVPAYGATDQHSQMQLFMEGPRDKCLFMLEVCSKEHDFTLDNNVEKSSFKKLKKYSLNQLLEAELNGTLQALKENERDFIHLQLPKNDEESMGAMILFFESLTALMGHYLLVDPFDQPGVEKGKIYAYQYLNSLRV